MNRKMMLGFVVLVLIAAAAISGAADAAAPQSKLSPDEQELVDQAVDITRLEGKDRQGFTVEPTTLYEETSRRSGVVGELAIGTKVEADIIIVFYDIHPKHGMTMHPWIHIVKPFRGWADEGINILIEPFL